MVRWIFIVLLLLPLSIYSQFELGINATSGIVRTYNYVLPGKNIAPTFQSKNLNKYVWGILFDFKIYKGLYIAIGSEHKDMQVEVSQEFKTSQFTQSRFGQTGFTKIGHTSGWGYWSFPLRISYKQFLDQKKNFFVSPNLGISYLYNLTLNHGVLIGNSIFAIEDTALLMASLNEKEVTNLNVNLFQLQVGAEVGWRHKFFSLYLGVNYSKGLNKKFIYKLESTEKDLYANTPTVNYNANVESKGSNLNAYLGMRFQLYPIIIAKKKIKLE